MCWPPLLVQSLANSLGKAVEEGSSARATATLQHVEETWKELFGLSFSLSKPWLLSEPVEENESLSLASLSSVSDVHIISLENANYSIPSK